MRLHLSAALVALLASSASPTFAETASTETTSTKTAPAEDATVETATAERISDRAFEERCRNAVLDLHVFFEDWFNARVPQNAENLGRFRDVLADDFEYIGSAGYKLPKAELFPDNNWPAYGYWKKDGLLGGETRVEELQFRRISQDTAILTWEYWQDTSSEGGEKKSRGRLDTGIFRLDADKPHGVVWLHVHETLLPGMEPR